MPDSTSLPATPWPRRTLRALAWLAVAIGCVLAAVILAIRFWLLPNIDDHRAAIARELGEALHGRIEIGQIALTWSGLQPRLTMTDVRLLDAAGAATLGVKQIENSLPWRSLLHGNWQFDSFRITQLEIVIRRDSAGQVFVAGYPLEQTRGDDGIGAWLLGQPRIAIDDAVLIWQDELRAAPPLRFSGVGGELENDGREHRFALSGSPPAALAAPFDVRGEFWKPAQTPPRLTANPDSDPESGAMSPWRGSVYLNTAQADVGAFKRWLPLPPLLVGGSGAVSAWLAVGNARIEHAVVDARVRNVVARLAPGLDPLEIPAAQTRMLWDSASRRFDLFVTNAEVKTADGEGIAGSFDISEIGVGQSAPVQRGSIRVDRMAFAAFTDLARSLPIAPELIERGKALAPAGMLEHLAVEWRGAWPKPEQYRVDADIHELAVNASGKAPAFSGGSGHIAFNEDGGSLALEASAAAVELPGVFADTLRFDRLTGDISWSDHALPVIDVKGLAFANAHLAGSVSGRYQTVAGRRGIADLSAQLSRADVRFAARYTPLAAGNKTREWLAKALRAGEIEKAHLRLQGDLDGFPFTRHNAGTFEAHATVSGGIVDYVDSWPIAERIRAEVHVRGARMEITTSDAIVAGLRVSSGSAVIPVIGNGDEVLQLRGEVSGASARFLRAVESSPLAGHKGISEALSKFGVEGDGKLNLALAVPLRHAADMRFSGDYAFADNRISVGARLPALEKARGKLEFSNAGIEAHGIDAALRGNAVTLVLSAPIGKPSTLTIDGRASLAEVLRIAGIDHPFLDSVRGASDWRAELRWQPDIAEWSIRSDLVGIASALPAPLDKTASTRVPLNLNGVSRESGDRCYIDYGDVIHANLAPGRADNSGAEGQLRGEIRLGPASSTPAAAPADVNGLSLAGSLPKLDFDAWYARFNSDAWQALFNRTNGGSNHDSAAEGIRLRRIAVHIDEAIVFDHRFTGLRVDAHASDTGWNARLVAAELDGNLDWQTGRERQGQTVATVALGQPKDSAGKLTVRLQRLFLPAANDRADARLAEAREAAGHETAHTTPNFAAGRLPAIDLQIADFRTNDVPLGQFTLLGRPDGEDWRVERLHVSAADAELEADGLWYGGGHGGDEARTRLNVKLDIADIGAFFQRVDFPDGMKAGRAALTGSLSWPGNPLDLRYTNLSGNLALHAHDGRFAKIEPSLGMGIGKLLGVLSLQNLPRRMALDFDDVLAKGYSFDEIAADIDIQHGVANSDEFVISSPSARTVLSGEVDLAAETQNLHVKVTPSFSDSLSLATVLLGGPVIGLTSYVLQKMLKDPIGKLTAHRYRLTGTWLAPTLSSLDETPSPE